MQIAVLGTGTMGAAMARSLLREGHAVRVWNRTPDKAEPLAADGATVAPDARTAVAGAEVVVTMLFDAGAVLSVVDEVADAFGPDTVLLQSSTIGRDATARLAEVAARRSLKVLDAPVLGTKKPAEDGALVMLVSGDPGLRERVTPALEAMGAKTVWAGDELGAASALKLACNAWVATITAATAQSIALARAFGLDPQLFLDAIGGGASDTPYAHVKGAQMIAGDYPPSFALDGLLKDLMLIGAAADVAGAGNPVLSGLQQAYQQASDAGRGSDDIAAVYAAFSGE